MAHVWLALGIGIPLSLLAAALPAFEASRVPPTAAIRGSDRLEMRVRLSARAIAAPLLVLAAAIGLAQLGPVNGRPLFGYASGVAIIVGASLLVPVLLFAMARLVRRPLRRLLGAEGLLAHAHLASAIPRLSISVAALSVSLAMLVAVAVMIGSFRDTVVYWVGQTINADLFVGPGVQPTVGSAQTLSPEVVNAVRTHPGVEAVDSFRNIDLVYRGNLVVLGAGHFDVVRSHGATALQDPGRWPRGAGTGDRRRCRRGVGGIRLSLRAPHLATRCNCPHPRGTSRSAWRASTTTTPWTAASSPWIAAPS